MHNNLLEQSSIDVLGQIDAAYSSLTKNEKRIADSIREIEGQLPNLTITMLAKKLNTSPTSITRFCQKLHYSGFSEMRYQMKYGVSLSEYDRYNIQQDDTPLIIKKKLSTFIENAVHESLTSLSDQSIRRAAKAINKANNITIFSEGGPSGTASCIQQLLYQTGLSCISISDTQFSLIAAMQMSSNDVVIVISRTGEPIHILEAVKIAKHQKAVIIAITSNETSPMAQMANINLLYADRIKDNLRYLHIARICEIAVFGALQSYIINDMGEAAAREKLSVKEGINLGRVSTTKTAQKNVFKDK